jgi:hypothetical protein
MDWHRTPCHAVLVLLACMSTTGGAQGQTPLPPPPNPSWMWPLYEIDVPHFLSTTEIIATHPRPAIWSSHGEFQKFRATLPTDVHPGIDIRGDTTDVVLFPKAGIVVHASNPGDCTGYSAGVYCRIWVRVSAQYIYYVGHMDVAHGPHDDAHPAVREAIQNARDDSVPKSIVQQGQVAGQLTPGYLHDWHHVHLGVFDSFDSYASVDPLPFLERPVMGAGGMTLVDDERPVVKDVELTPHPSDPGARVESDGLCGLEVRGAIEITADIKDTFYTDPPPRPFPGDHLQPTQGVKGARYVVRNLAEPGEGIGHPWFESPVGCTYTECGMWRLRFPAAEQPHLVSDASFFAWLGEDPPEYVGGDFTEYLWDAARSSHDHDHDGPEQPIIHVLTANAREDGALVADAWNTTSLVDGRYVITVEAWDNDGNVGGQSFLTTVNNSGTLEPPPSPTKGWAEVMVKDHPNDFGQIPSNLGGEAWWRSDDILIVPAGTQNVSCATSPRGFPVVANEAYDVYVRAHNVGCQDMPGVQAAVYSATPGTMLTNIRAISSPPGVYAGDPVLVPAGGCEVIGPFPWTPSQADLDGTEEGHRCLLAAINSELDPGPAVNPAEWDVPNHDNVTQRNIQVSQLEFFIRNDTLVPADAVLHLDMGSFPTGTADASFRLLIDDPMHELDALWEGTPGTIISREGANIVVDVQAGLVTLPAFAMPALSDRASRVEHRLPFLSGPHHVVLTHVLGGVPVGGMEFILRGPALPT